MPPAPLTMNRIPSPLRLFFTILVIFFIAEAAVMLVLPGLLGDVYRTAAPVVDTMLLMVLTAPFLWWFVARPLRGAALREQARAATVIATVRDGIVTINDEGLVESFNPAAERIFGYAAEEVRGRPLAMLFPQRLRREYQETVDAARKGGDTRDRVVQVHALRKDGSELPAEISLATSNVPDHTFDTAVVRDVTERYRTEQALRARTNQLETMRAVAAEITRELDLGVLLDLITRRALELFEVQRGSLLLLDERTRRLEVKTQYGFAPHEVLELTSSEGFAEIVAQRREGAIVHDASGSPYVREVADEPRLSLIGQPLLYHDRLLGVIVLSSQGTERRFTEQDVEMLGIFAYQAAIAIENAQLYDQVESLAVVQERQRIAREMHDSLAQSLGLLYMQARRLREEHATAGSAIEAALDDMTRITKHASDELRQSMFGLRTVVSSELGWIPTLTEYLHEFSTRTGIRVITEAPDEVPSRLRPSTEVQLVRIIHEALANVSKHARAALARVRVQSDERWLRVIIEDDGQGFDPERLPTRSHFGLATMRERAESLGGKLEIDSAPGEGTRIIVTLPAEALA